MVVALCLLAAVPLAAGTLPGTRSWRVTLAAHAGPDSAATARRLAAMYRGELETPVDAQGAFLVALTDAAAALLEADPAVQSLQPEGAEAVPSSPSPTTRVRTPQIAANATASWSLGTYSYDGSGNIEKIGLDPYVYDLQNRLVSGVAGGKTEQYTYDEFGNILTIETTGSAKQYLGVDAATNRMSQTTGTVGGQTVTYDKTAGYDAAGNVTSHLLDQFQYDGLNVLTKAYVASKWRSYVYNASDERISVIERSSATGAETRSDWTLRDASGQVLRRLSREGGQWQWNEDYIYRGSQMLAAEVAGPAKRYHYHLDHLGTPRLITGNGGVEISRHTYLPFGTEVGAIAGQNPADGEWKKFTGHERDQGSIDYMHARYYNPFVGRFLSVDPTWESADLGKPQSWNRYGYVMNNPINLTDPDGRCPSSLTGRRCANPLDGSTLVIRREKHNPINGEFGMTRDAGTKPHQGVDLLSNKGTPVTAADGGKIVFAGKQRGHGNIVIIAHQNAAGKDVSFTSYSHLDVMDVKKNDTVEQGQQIGSVGRTGITTEAIPTHLHFEIRREQEPGKGEQALRKRVDPGPELGLDSRKREQ